jgi:hypothetical protein
MKRILDQLARSGLLWDDEMVAAIFAGNILPLDDIALALMIGVMDAEALVRGDAGSTSNEKRIARQCLAVAFLTLVACAKEQAS